MEIDFIRLLFAFILGTACGLKTELEKTQGEGDGLMGGLRTHAILAILGILSGFLYLNGIEILVVLIALLIVALVVVYYASGVFSQVAYGITSEITIITAFSISFLFVATDISSKLLVAISILVVFITTAEEKIHALRERIAPREIVQFSIFAVIALVILPFLPNQTFNLKELGIDISQIQFLGLKDIADLALINPYKVWFIVVAFSSIELIGYVLNKFVKHDQSIILTSLLGGFLSSTTTTVSLANKCEGKYSNKILAAIFFTNAASFVQISLLLLPVSLSLFRIILFLNILLLIGFSGLGVLFYRKSVSRKGSDIQLKDKFKIISLGPAVKFAFSLALIKMVSSILLSLFGKSVFVISSLFAAVTGIDAVVLSMGELVNDGVIVADLAILTYIGIQLVNFLSKSFYIFNSGNKKLMLKFMKFSMSVILISAFLGYFLR